MRHEQRFDAIVIGGGVMGSSTTYHLLKAEPSLAVAMVERDPAYTQASSALSVGNARIQFSLRQNIQISRYTFEVLRSFSEDMAIGEASVDIRFRREGNLFVVSEADRLRRQAAWSLQKELGCSVEWWSSDEVRRRFPLYDTERYVAATFGPDEGHLDGYAFLMGFKNKAMEQGGVFVHGEVARITEAKGRVTGVELTSGETLAAPVVVNCGGAWAADIAATVGVDLPVVPVQRQVFIVEPAVRPRGPLPLTGLPSGLYFRSEGEDRVLVGKSMAGDRLGFDLRWEERRFTDSLWPELAAFVPAFDRLRLERGWTGLYAVNRFDGNAILGEWPELEGLYVANGFSGHGLQQAPAVGRYLAELITGRPCSLDLSVFGPRRLLEGSPLSEAALV